MHLRKFTVYYLFFIIISLTGCKSEPELSLKENSDGWYLKETSSGDHEKFFAIGAWNVPGHEDEITEPNNEVREKFYKRQTSNVNIVLMHMQNWEDYMHEQNKILMSIKPSLFLMDYLGNMPSLSDKGAEKGYYQSQYLKNIQNDEKLLQEFDKALDKHVNIDFKNVERAYLPIDEVGLGLAGSHWFIPPLVGDLIYEKLKKFDPNTIVFVDLAGHGKGSSFFFEQRYLKDHSSMPTDPPYEVLSESAQSYAKNAISEGKGLPLIGFNEGYDGIPGYQFKDNKYSYRSYTLEELKSFHYENIKLYAEAYKGNGNVFGLNAFRDFYAHPVLAGVTVDAIRAGLGDPTIPIWLFFDGNGYAKPKEMSAEEYVNEVKCQMFTSIIHGATGVFFWNTRTKEYDVWDALQPILVEIRDNLDLIKLETVEKINDDNLHIVIKKNDKDQKYIIASNTSKTDSIPLKIENVEKESLNPLEVYISPIN